MNEETLLDELNDLCENILCPMDLMDSISDYTNEKIVEELEKIGDMPLKTTQGDISEYLHNRIKELER
jgi:hypothetical protein